MKRTGSSFCIVPRALLAVLALRCARRSPCGGAAPAVARRRRWNAAPGHRASRASLASPSAGATADSLPPGFDNRPHQHPFMDLDYGR